MVRTLEIIHEAEALPVEERALIVDSLLQSLNRSDASVEKKWMDVAKRRMEELRSGDVKGLPAADVFDRIQQQFAE